MKTMTCLFAAAAACLVSTGAEAAVTYTITQGSNINIRFETATPLTTAMTMTDFTDQRCVVSSIMSSGLKCTSLTLDPSYKDNKGQGSVLLFLESPNTKVGYSFGTDTLSINGSYTTGFLNRITLTVSGAPAFIPPVATAVPEPATWALMLAGFGLTGAAMRRRRRVATAFA